MHATNNSVGALLRAFVAIVASVERDAVENGIYVFVLDIPPDPAHTFSVMRWLKYMLLDPEFHRRREFLQRVSLFKGISRREFGTLFQSLIVRNYPIGEMLCREGDIGRALFLLERGQVEVVRKMPESVLRRVAILKPGDYFGEMSLIDEQPRTASVVAIEPVRAYLLYKTEIEKLTRDAPHIAAAIMTHLATLLAVRLRSTMSSTPFSLDSTDKAWTAVTPKVVPAA